MPGNHLLYAVVNSAGDIYVCLREHQSNPMNEPGFGPDWPLYWRLDNSYVGLYGVWVGPLISVHYRPPSIVTLWQRQREHATLWPGATRTRRLFLEFAPAYVSPSRLLNVSTRRHFGSTVRTIQGPQRSQAARAFMLGQKFQFFQSFKRIKRAPYRQPQAGVPMRLNRSWILARSNFFESYVRVRGRPPWLGMTDATSAAYVELWNCRKRRRGQWTGAAIGANGGIPKLGVRTITPEMSHFVAGV